MSLRSFTPSPMTAAETAVALKSTMSSIASAEIIASQHNVLLSKRQGNL